MRDSENDLLNRIRVPGEITPETAGNSQKHSANSLLTADRALVARSSRVFAKMTTIFTKEQCEILEYARSGHNILITGQAGTGKSTIVNAIREDCKQRGLKVALVCSSGIACHVYERGIASTAHSYYALGAADMPSEKLILRAISDVRITEKLRKVDVVIWDEASMSSARMLELANALHHRAYECDGEENKMPFAETQVIVVGEFLQLRPVPNSFDSGDFMFTYVHNSLSARRTPSFPV